MCLKTISIFFSASRFVVTNVSIIKKKRERDFFPPFLFDNSQRADGKKGATQKSLFLTLVNRFMDGKLPLCTLTIFLLFAHPMVELFFRLLSFPRSTFIAHSLKISAVKVVSDGSVMLVKNVGKPSKPESNEKSNLICSVIYLKFNVETK
jgi:hypothetical protein